MNPVQFPNETQLAPFLDKLQADPAGVVLLAITGDPETQNYYGVQMAFLSGTERADLKRGLQRAKAKREAGKA